MYQKHSKTSKYAYDVHDFDTRRDAVLQVIKDIGLGMATGKVVAALLNLEFHLVSPRIHELCISGDVVLTTLGEVYNLDSGVYVAAELWKPWMGKGVIKKRGGKLERAAKELIEKLDGYCHLPEFEKLKEALEK